jgi:hypothetical protein
MPVIDATQFLLLLNISLRRFIHRESPLFFMLANLIRIFSS